MHVCGFHAEQFATDHRLEAGRGAALVVRGEHRVAEGRVPRRLTHSHCARGGHPRNQPVRFEADARQDIGVQRLLEVLVEQQLHGAPRQALVREQRPGVPIGDAC